VDTPQLLKRLDKAWVAFSESYAGLSDSELMEPGVTGAWSVRDILAHVTTWEEEALKHLPLILKGGKPPRYSVTYGGIDAFNAQTTEQKRSLSLSEVRRQLARTHRRLIAFIESSPEDQFIRETRFRRRLRLDTYSHYPLHAEGIRKWRQQRPAGRYAGPGQRSGGDGTKTWTLVGPDRRLYQSAMPGTLGGHKQGLLYGRLDCPAALRAIARGGYVQERVFFANEQAAIAAGYRPCAACLPERYALWRVRERGAMARRAPGLPARRSASHRG
jgi:hypothetical protein